MTNRLIVSLGKTNQKKLRDFGNSILGTNFKQITQFRSLLGLNNNNDTYIDLMHTYNTEVEKQQTLNKSARKQKQKLQRIEKKTITNNKASIISKFFQNYKKPINMEKRMKYKDNEGNITYEKQFVDVYKITTSQLVSLYSEEFEIMRNKTIQLLGNLYKRYKSGVIQIDILGRWKEKISKEGFSFESFLNPEVIIDKVSIEAFELKPKNYLKFSQLIFEHLQPPNTSSWFEVKEIDIKFIKPINGGCYTCKGHGKQMKLKNLTLYNPKLKGAGSLPTKRPNGKV